MVEALDDDDQSSSLSERQPSVSRNSSSVLDSVSELDQYEKEMFNKNANNINQAVLNPLDRQITEQRRLSGSGFKRKKTNFKFYSWGSFSLSF